MGTGRQYDEKFKLEAIKLAKEIGTIANVINKSTLTLKV